MHYNNRAVKQVAPIIISLFLFLAACKVDNRPMKVEYLEGWNTCDNVEYCWSNGTQSNLKLIIPEKKEKIIVKIKGSYFNPSRPSEIYYNGKKIVDITFDSNQEQIFKLTIDNEREIHWTIKHYDVNSPKELGISNDNRKIKLNLYQVETL